MPTKPDSAALRWLSERFQHVTLLRNHHQLSLGAFTGGAWTIEILSYPFEIDNKSKACVIDLYKSVFQGLPSFTVTSPNGLGLQGCTKRVQSAYQYITANRATPDYVLLLNRGKGVYEIIDGHHRIAAATRYTIAHSKQTVSCPCEILHI